MSFKRFVCLLIAMLLAFVSVLPVFAAESEMPIAELEKIVKRTFGEEYSLGLVVPCIRKGDILYPYQDIEEMLVEPQCYGGQLLQKVTVNRDGQFREAIANAGTAYFVKLESGAWVLKDYDFEDTKPGLVWGVGERAGIDPPEERKYLDLISGNVVGDYDSVEKLLWRDYSAVASYESRMGITYPKENFEDALAEANAYWFGDSIDGGNGNDGKTWEQVAYQAVEGKYGAVKSCEEICDLYSATNLAAVTETIYDLAVLQGKNSLEAYPVTLFADVNPGKAVKVTAEDGDCILFLKQDDRDRWYLLGMDTDSKDFDRDIKLFQKRSDSAEPALYVIELSDGSTDHYLFGGGYLHRMNTNVTYESEPVIKRLYDRVGTEGIERLTVQQSRVILLPVMDADAISIPTSVWHTVTVIVLIVGTLLACSLILWKIGAPNSWIANSWIVQLPAAFRYWNRR